MVRPVNLIITPAEPARLAGSPLGERMKRLFDWGVAWKEGTPASKVSVRVSSLAAADTTRVEPGPDPEREKVQVSLVDAGAAAAPEEDAGAPTPAGLEAGADGAAAGAWVPDDGRVAAWPWLAEQAASAMVSAANENRILMT